MPENKHPNGSPASSWSVFIDRVGTVFSYTVITIVLLGVGVPIVWFVGTIAVEVMFGGIDTDMAANEPPEREYVEIPPAGTPSVAEEWWRCSYLPTMNDNWHDDVECSNGVESVRPELLTDQSFVTEDEMKAAALEHEKKLNGY